ncbi:MAG: hypothetical protein ACU85V_03915 [Gammaproteobacteria bacterium]
MIQRPVRAAAPAAIITLLLATAALAATPDDGGSLRGLERVYLSVEGVERSFERYGLTADALHASVAARLRAGGIDVVENAGAADHIGIVLRTNQEATGLRPYGLSLEVRRGVPLQGAGTWRPDAVWSRGRNGILNPSDLGRITDYAAALVDEFLAAHGRANASARASLD